MSQTQEQGPPDDSRVDALLSLRSSGKGSLGRERIDLLEAVGTHGSITAAARASGISYKAAWDAINAANNLFLYPVVEPHVGGHKGGGAILTRYGRRIIDTFRSLESTLAGLVSSLSEAPDSLEDLDTVLWGATMKTSARNAFRCRIENIILEAVNADVRLRLSDQATLSATITRESVRDLGLKEGGTVTALIKASFIILARVGEGGEQAILQTSARNQIPGTVLQREDGAVQSEITLDIGSGKTLSATITRESADALNLLPGSRAMALIKASHVILATHAA